MLVLAKKPSTTTYSSMSRSSVVETVLASRLEPRDGTAIGASASALSSNRVIFALDAACTSARNCQEFQCFGRHLKLGLERIGERQIHICPIVGPPARQSFIAGLVSGRPVVRVSEADPRSARGVHAGYFQLGHSFSRGAP